MPNAPKRPFDRFRAALSIGLCLVLALAYTFRTDAFYAATIWPAFVWMIPGAMTLFYRRPNKRSWSAWGPVLVWLASVLAFSEEPWMVLRGILPAPPRPASGVRVVTLNCASSTEAAAEVWQWKPDIVLFQESPSEDDLKVLAKKWFGASGSVLSGPDCSIVAKGQLEELGQSHFEINRAAARWRRPGYPPMTVVSLRMDPPTFRLDYFNPDCWRDYASDRHGRRHELAEIWKQTAALAGSDPILLGGDCNTPPDPGTFAPISGSLRDAFSVAGRGWPGTAHNTYAFARIDQVWVSKEFRPVCAWTKKTVYSDHRMAVFDLAFEER